MSKKKPGHNVIITGATHRRMDENDKTINGINYTMYVPQRNCSNEMGKPYSRTISAIARREGYAQNGDHHDTWIEAIQKVFDNHYDEISGVEGFNEFHSKKVYFYNSRYDGTRRECMYLAVKRKPYNQQEGPHRERPKRKRKTRKKKELSKAKTQKKKDVCKKKKAKLQGQVSSDGSGWIPNVSTSSSRNNNYNSDSSDGSAIEPIPDDENCIENPLTLWEPMVDGDHEKDPVNFPLMRKGNRLLVPLDYNKYKDKFPKAWLEGDGKKGKPIWWDNLLVKEGDDSTLYISRQDWLDLYESYHGSDETGIDELFEFLTEMDDGVFDGNFRLIKDAKVGKPKAKSSSSSSSDHDNTDDAFTRQAVERQQKIQEEWGHSSDSDGYQSSGYDSAEGTFSKERHVPGTAAWHRRNDEIEDARERQDRRIEERQNEAYQEARDRQDGIFKDPAEQAAYDEQEEEDRRAWEEDERREEEDNRRRREVQSMEYARANGWTRHESRSQNGRVFYYHTKSGARVWGDKDGLFDAKEAQKQYDKAMSGKKKGGKRRKRTRRKKKKKKRTRKR